MITMMEANSVQFLGGCDGLDQQSEAIVWIKFPPVPLLNQDPLSCSTASAYNCLEMKEMLPASDAGGLPVYHVIARTVRGFGHTLL